MKFFYGCLTTNNRQKKVGRSLDDQCILFGEPEKCFHIFNCRHKELTGKRKTLWEEAQKKLRKCITPYALRALNIGFMQERTEEDIQDSDQFITNKDTWAVYRRQFQIGWRQIYLGHFHKQWRRTLLFHTDGNEEAGLTKVIAVMWSFGLHLWQ